MKNLILNLVAFIALIFTVSAASAHPSVHHTGDEGFLHEASFALIVVVAFIVGLMFLKKTKTKR